MAHDTLKLSDQEVLRDARTVLRAYLPLTADGYVCTSDDLYDVLLGVAVNATGTASGRGTIQSICTDWLGIADPATIRGDLNSQLRVEDWPLLERRLNAALAAQIPPRVKGQAQNVAIDLHDRP